MTQEDKQLLLKDLCARLPYGVKINIYDYSGTMKNEELNAFHINSTYNIEYRKLRPYLRPMSSMTEEEKEEYSNECNRVLSMPFKINGPYPIVDWLNVHHFDFRGLIEKGLAIEAPDNMYNNSNNNN